MNIKPIDVLNMLDDDELSDIELEDLYKLCNAISLDLQVEREKYQCKNILNEN